MARHERWQGLGRIVVRQANCSHKGGAIAAMARSLRGLFAHSTKKPLDYYSFYAAACGLKSTSGERKPMSNKEKVFANVDGQLFISVARIVEGTVSLPGSNEQAFMINKNNCGETLEYFKSLIDDSKLGCSVTNVTNVSTGPALGDDDVSKVVTGIRAMLIKESRPGGILWNSSITVESAERAIGDKAFAETVATMQIQGAQLAAAVMSIDELAQEHYSTHAKHGVSVDENWREAYRVANLRISLRSQVVQRPDYIESEGFGKPGRTGWRLHKGGQVTIHDGFGYETAKLRPSDNGSWLVIPLQGGWTILIKDGRFEVRDQHNGVRAMSGGK